MSDEMSPDLLSLLFSGKLPLDDGSQKAATPPPGLMMRPPAAPAPPPAAATARVSDDPSVTGLPALPSAPKLRTPNDQLRGRLATAQAPIDRDQYKPKWYDWLAGAGAGVLGANPVPLINRRLNTAKSDQRTNVDSLTHQLEQEDKANKDYNATQENTFKNQMDVAQEGRLRQTADQTASYHQDLNDLRANVEAGKLDVAKQKLEQMEQNGKDNAAYRLQMLQQKQELIDLKEKMAGQDGKPATTKDSIAIEEKRNNAWNKAHRDLSTALTRLGPKDAKGQEQARRDYYDARQTAQDEYESAIRIGKGTADHVELPRNHFGEEGATPAAQPAAAPAGQPKGGASKAVAKSVVQDYANSHKLTYQQAAQGFKSKGYTVQ